MLEIETTLGEIEPKLVDHVEKFTKPLFILFDYYNIPRTTLEKKVNEFVAQKAD